MTFLSRLLGRDRAATSVDPGAAEDVGRSPTEGLVAAREALARGDLASAYGWASDAVASSPSNADALRIGAGTLTAWSRHGEALVWHRRLAELPSALAEDHCRHAMAALSVGQLLEAAAAFGDAERIDPRSPDAAAGVARSLLAQGQVSEASAQVRRALERQGMSAPLLVALSQCERAAGRMADAESGLCDALELSPGSAGAWALLAQVRAAREDWDGALEALGRGRCAALAAEEPDDTFAAVAHVLRLKGATDQAFELLLRNLPACPHGIAQYLYGEILLTQGSYEAGWRQFEFRWLHEALIGKRGAYGRPEWNGQDLRGRTVLVQAEQGIGDVVMFARYLPLVKRLGARVLFLPRVDMDRIARRLPGVDEVLSDGQALPPFDFVTYLMALPRVFGTTLDSIPPNVPYLAADGERKRAWGERLTDTNRPRVGLVWGGRPTQVRNHLRSIPLRELVPLLRVPGASFFSLQKGPAEAELAHLPPDVHIEALGPEMNDLEDLVAAMDSMDLVVSVCTGPAHIAGAMGKPVWTMISEPPDLRWLVGREDSPWYPTMRLFRQAVSGRWDDVVARVARELGRGPSAWAALTVPPARIFEPAPARYNPRPDDADAGMAQLAETRQGLLMYDPAEPLIGASIGRYGEWRHSDLELALRMLESGSVVVEVGAGVGAHAVALARAIGPEGRIFACEPRPAIRRMLRQNFATNGIAHAVVISHDLADRGMPEPGGRRETLDGLRLDRLAVLKANLPADAGALLGGARDTIWRCRPWVMLEIEGDDAWPGLRATMREFGYRTWFRSTALFSPSNFNLRDDDAFAGRTTVNLVALPEECDLREPLPGCVELS